MAAAEQGNEHDEDFIHLAQDERREIAVERAERFLRWIHMRSEQ